MKSLIIIFFLIFAQKVSAQTLKVCVPMFDSCAHFVIRNGTKTFVTADTPLFSKIKKVDQTFPIKLLTASEMSVISQGPVQTAEVSSEAIDKMGRDLDTSHKLCNAASMTCGLGVIGTIGEIFRAGPEAGLFPFAATVVTCFGTVYQCKDYWDKYADYKKLVEEEKAKNPQPVYHGASGGDPVPVARPIRPIGPGGGINCKTYSGTSISDGTTKWDSPSMVVCMPGPS